MVNRLSGHAFAIKGLSVTVASAAAGLAITEGETLVVYAALGPIAVFAGMDAYYLRLERAFRATYEAARQRTDCDFALKPIDPAPFHSWLKAFRSPAIYGLYVPTAAFLISIGSICL